MKLTTTQQKKLIKQYSVLIKNFKGHTEFLNVLYQMATTHSAKSNDYATAEEALKNLKLSEHLEILPAWKSTYIRILDKVSRLANAFKDKNMKNESVEDTFLDLANYAVLALLLYQEAHKRK